MTEMPYLLITFAEVATPQRAAKRSNVFTQKFMPGCTDGRAANGLSAMPATSAITMLGMGTTFATKGAAM